MLADTPIQLVTPHEAARILNNTPVRTLERWRATGRGPKFVKLGRKVNYSIPDLMEFVKSQTRTHTGQQK